MVRGLYTSGWSMMANSKRMDVISNNLANVNTNAYKKDTVVFQTFPDVLTRRINDTRSSLNPSARVGNMELGSDVGEIFTYYNQGQLVKTDNNLNMSIQGSDTAFFTVGIQGSDGQMNEYYTRDGDFVLNANGRLETRDGNPVMGQDGPITLKNEDFSVESDGTIIQDGATVGKLLIKDFTDTTTLRKFGSNLVQKTDSTQEQEFTGAVAQGYLEQSNVNIVKEMVDMISVMRSYEANQKVLQAQDNTLEKAVNEVGATR